MGKEKNESLESNYPDIARQWHPTRNGETNLSTVKCNSRQTYWWICPNGHEYEASVHRRLQGFACPYDSGLKVNPERSLATLFPEVSKQWHPTKNGKLTPYDVTSQSNKKVWWLCTDGHDWQAPVYSRTAGRGCPICAGRIVSKDTSLAQREPELANEWDTEKNTITPSEVTPYSNKKVWWKCNVGHEWNAPVNRRTIGAGCPYCSGKKASIENSLATVHPELVCEWHETKNNCTPADVTPMSNKKVFWQCKKDPEHVWEARIANRSHSKSGCPICRRKSQGEGKNGEQ